VKKKKRVKSHNFIHRNSSTHLIFNLSKKFLLANIVYPQRLSYSSSKSSLECQQSQRHIIHFSLYRTKKRSVPLSNISFGGQYKPYAGIPTPALHPQIYTSSKTHSSNSSAKHAYRQQSPPLDAVRHSGQKMERWPTRTPLRCPLG